MLTDDKDVRQKIQLKNVIYLPESAKNLISTTQWSKEKGDDCGILSRGSYSTFFWNNDENKKQILHSPTCPIPLMLVNEGDEAFILYLQQHSSSYPDNTLLLPNGAPSQLDDCTISTAERATNLDKQSKKVHSNSSFQS